MLTTIWSGDLLQWQKYQSTPTYLHTNRLAQGTSTRMRLLIIRHAESSNNSLAIQLQLQTANYMQQRSPDPVITERGVRQAELLAAHLAGEPPADAPPGGKGRYG